MEVIENYDGKVRPGGPAMRRDLGALRITKLSVGPLDNNAYLLVSRDSGDALLIDAANEASRLMELVATAGGAARLRYILTTHRHFDHWQALVEVAGATKAACVAHPVDAPELPIPMDATISDGDALDLGQVRLEAIHLRGHTPGSVALLYTDPGGGPHLFTGDCLFPGGPGKTWSPEAFGQLMGDLEEKVFGRLPDDTWIYPGHGNDTTLGAERPHLQEWRDRGW